MRQKISFIGAGNIGGTMASIASEWNNIDIVLYDINSGAAKGKALDIAQMNASLCRPCSIVGSGDISDIQGSDVVIITAGLARTPGMTREGLLASNAEIIKSIALSVKTFSPEAFCIVVTNPLDAMVFQFQKHSMLPKNKVVGMAGTLDSARFKYFLSQELGVSPANIEAIVLGGHGDSMVPAKSCVSVSGISIEKMMEGGLCTQELFDRVVARTRNGGAEIVDLLKNGSAFYAPAVCSLEIAKAFLSNERKIMPVCAFLNGEYGAKDMAFGVPAVIGSNGVESILQAPLSESEQGALNKSVDSVKTLVASLPS